MYELEGADSSCRKEILMTGVQANSRAHNRRMARLLQILVVLLLGGIFYRVGLCTPASDPTKGISAERALGNLANQLSRGEISRIEVSYYNWTAETPGSLTEEDLLRNPTCRVIISNQWYLNDLIDALKAFQPERYKGMGRVPADVHLGCLFYSKDGKEVIRLLFKCHSPVVWISDVPYRATADLLQAMAQFVPRKAYDEIQQTIFSLWMANG